MFECIQRRLTQLGKILKLISGSSINVIFIDVMFTKYF